MFIIPVLLWEEGRQRHENLWKLMGQLVWHMQWKIKDTVSGKVEDEDQQLRLSSDLNVHTVACLYSHKHMHTYMHTVHIHTTYPPNR